MYKQISMREPIEIVETQRPDGKRGIKILHDIYTNIANYIFGQIKDHRQVTLTTLLTDVEGEFKTCSNIIWLAYHVKLDLEAKGHIKVTRSARKDSVAQIRLTSPVKGGRRGAYSSPRQAS